MGGANGRSEPLNDGGLVLGVCFVIWRTAPLGCDVDTTDDENHGVVGNRRRQRLSAMDVDANGGADGARSADVTNVEVDRILLEVGAAEHLERTTEIK